MIKIETKKIVQDGVCGREILNIKALPARKLPKLYFTQEKEAVYMGDVLSDTLFLKNAWPELSNSYDPGVTLTEIEFKNLIAFCYKAGDNLKAVNAKLKALKEEWQGLETFCI